MALSNGNPQDTSINLVDLDFHELKNSFKNYLRSQPQFKDYDFDGSNINVLLDLLSYNTHKNIFFLNMAISEGFLDSAQLRNSILSKAKELNYLPRSVRSASAKVRVTFDATGESQPYIIQKGSMFSTLIKNQSYTFSMPETITVSSANNTFQFETEIFEGVYQKDAYIYLDNIENQRFKISAKNVDTRSLTVTVYEDNSEVGDIYKHATTLLDLNYNSKVYFLQTSETGHYEVLFGDGVLGRKPKINSTIVLDYRVSSGEAGNGARSFSVDFDPTGENELLTTPELEVLEPGRNGAEEETTESIRYYAPRHFQVQERAVTTDDYEISLKTEFPEINAVTVFGGEEMDPPRYGKVFVSVDIANVDGLPESKKTEYYRFLKRRSPLSIDPIFIEPEFTYLRVDSLVRYNINITTISAQRIKTLVTDAIMSYNELYLNDFNVSLRYSPFTCEIDQADTSIVSNITDVILYKKLQPRLGMQQSFELDFGMALKQNLPSSDTKHLIGFEHTITSTPFRFNGENCVLEDTGDGVVRIYKNSGAFNVKVKDIGTIDYETGVVRLNNLVIDSYDGASFKIYVRPEDKDINITKNTIMMIEPDEIHIDVEAIRL